MAVSGLSGSMLEMYAKASVDGRKDTRTMIDTQDKRAVAAAEQEMFMKDRANQEALNKQLFETVKAGVSAAKAVGKVGETAGKTGEAEQVKTDIKSALESGDMQALKQVDVKDGHTVGESLSDERLQQLMSAPGANGQPPTIDEQVARIQSEANPERANLRAAIESGDIDRIRSAPISEHSTVGDTMSDAKIREVLAEGGKDGKAPSIDEQVNHLMGTAQRREVTPETVRDKMVGELDRVAGHMLDNRRADDQKGAAETAKNKGQIKARRGEMYGQVSQTEQDLARVAQLAADANQPLFG